MSTSTKNGIIIHEPDITSCYAFVAASFPIICDSDNHLIYPEMYVDAKLVKLPNKARPIAIATFIFYDLIKAKLTSRVQLSCSMVQPKSTKLVDVNDDIVEYSIKLDEPNGRISITGTDYFLEWQFVGSGRVTISHNYGYITLDESKGIIVDDTNNAINRRAASTKESMAATNQRVAEMCSRTRVERDSLPMASVPVMSVFPTILVRQ